MTWSRPNKLMAALVVLLLTVAIGGFVLIRVKDSTYVESSPFQRTAEGPARVLVVYYSRSGNTQIMAREIARATQADVVELKAEAYSLDYAGWRRAGKDASDQVLAAVSPEVVDMSAYELIILGSPIWWFRPSPPLWTFVERNDFSGKKVVLFNSYNSRIKQEHIDTFRQRIAAKGGELIDHIHVRRGRVLWQLDSDELLAETRARLDARRDSWLAPP